MIDKTLLYNCCDDEYTHFIPIFCASSLFSNKNIDIEIGINLSRLTDNEESAIKELRAIHSDSEINIKHDFYKKIKRSGFDNALYEGMTMWSNTIRFLSEPEIKDKYTYICDIDVVMLMKNFYKYHIDVMNKYNTKYSNWVRDNDKLCLTGLHFVESDSFYPIDLNGINLHRVDEHILKEIQARKTEINDNIPRRPVCGLHFSKNQRLKEQLKLSDIYLKEMESYKDSFFNFLNSDEYKIVEKCNIPIITEYINEFKEHWT